MDAASRAGMAEIKRRILVSLEALNAIDGDSMPSEHGWRDNGPAEREVLAPVCDIDATELLRLHYHAMVRYCDCTAPYAVCSIVHLQRLSLYQLRINIVFRCILDSALIVQFQASILLLLQGSLLTPLWQLQCEVITELLQRAERAGVALVD